MKISPRSLCVSFFVALLTLAFGVKAYAETPREEIAHAFHLLKKADRKYDGHRVKAMDQVEVAGKALGLDLGGELADKEKKWKSDEQMKEARRLLVEARDKLEKRDKDLIADHVEVAIKEIDEALKIK
jgi:hypothetical protein